MTKTKRVFKEDFLQFVWKFQLINQQNLFTNCGQSISIIHPGEQNRIGGPDFLNAKIGLGSDTWVGNVEIHYDYKEWKSHKHHKDPAYNNVVLHVVYKQNGIPVESENGNSIPCLSISKRIFDNTLKKYRLLSKRDNRFIPCQHLINTSSHFLFHQFYESLVIERMERKLQDINFDLEYAKGSLEDAFLIQLFKYFGAPANKQPFGLLARSATLVELNKYSFSIKQMEALLFGLAGLLNDKDEYAIKLSNEYEFLNNLHKFDVKLNRSNWAFSGVRPSNFPTIRLAQLAALLVKDLRLFNRIIDDVDGDVKDVFDVDVTAYWKEHFNFGLPSRKSERNLSEAFIRKLKINVVAPFLFCYGKLQHKEEMVVRAIDMLQNCKAEDNGVLRKWKNLKVPMETAMDTQALLELKSSYCDSKRCLQCRIGYNVLNKNKK